MKSLKDVVIFGYGKFGYTIANSIKKEKDTIIKVVVNDEKEYDLAKSDAINVIKFNLESDNSILDLNIANDTILVCAMDNNHENLFLALTLREMYKSNYIIAVSDSIHLSNKLKKAGVDRVIDIYTISATIIENMLKIPIATNFLQGFINKTHDFKFDEIIIKQNSKFVGKRVKDIKFNQYNLVLVGMIDIEKGNQFTFFTIRDKDYIVTPGDILVCIGKEEDLERFKIAGGLK